MSYQPGPSDVRCQNQACQEWYHKALKSCPMCDAPAPVVAVSPPIQALASHTEKTPQRSSFWRRAEENPFPIAGAFLAVIFLVLFLLIGNDPKQGTTHKETHDLVTRLINRDSIYVRPYSASASATVRIVVPVNTSDREAQELAQVTRKYIERCGDNMVVRVETPAGQVLASRSSIWGP